MPDRTRTETAKGPTVLQIERRFARTLPADIAGALREEGLTWEVLDYVTTDLSLDHGLGYGALVLTTDTLYVLTFEHEGYTDFGAAVPADDGGFFRRNHKKVKEAARKALTPATIRHIEAYPLDTIVSVRLDNEVVGGTFVLEDKEMTRILLRFSGSRFKDMNHFARHVNGLIEELRIARDDTLEEAERREKIEKSIRERREAAEKVKQEEEESFCPNCGRRYPEEGRRFCPHCLPKQSVFLRLLSLFKPYKGRIVVLFIMIGLASVFNALIPWLSGTVLYDKVLRRDPEWLAAMERLGFGGKAVTALAVLIGMIFLTRLLQEVANVIRGRVVAHMVPGAVATIREKAFNALQKLSLGFFMRKQTGSLMQRVNGDAEEVTMFFTDFLPYFFFNIGTLIVTAVIMFQMNVILAMLSLFLLPPLFILSLRLIPRIWRSFGRVARHRRSVFSVLNDSLNGARVVRAFGQEEQLNRRFDRSSGRYRDAQMNVVNEQIRFNVPYSIAQGIPAILVWTVGGLLILQGTGALDLGQLISFTGYLGMLQGPLQFFSMVFIVYSQTMNSAQRMFEIIDARPEIEEADDPIETDLKGDIELSHVTFAYEVNKPVLKDISFKVKAGEMLGIVGKSGAGKSTLVNLIDRLYDVDEGQILLDGHDVRDLSFDSLRGAVAMVSQETYIFMGTVAENIAYARPDAPHEEIVRAAMAAAAHDFITKLPDGYDTLVGTGGRQLSGGERQRVSIARAILADPDILVLDEATASVDTETERMIQDSLDRLTKGRTTLSIAHRLSTLRNADRIIVLEEGRLTEEGTHKELEDRRGEYYHLMELQRKALAMRGIVDEDDVPSDSPEAGEPAVNGAASA